MEIIYKKNSKGPKSNRYAFPTTDDQKIKLDQLRDEKKIDVNEMLRKFADQIIAASEDQQSA
jgi:hypothetical protein